VDVDFFEALFFAMNVPPRPHYLQLWRRNSSTDSWNLQTMVIARSEDRALHTAM
jgi:hypothetical protein